MESFRNLWLSAAYTFTLTSLACVSASAQQQGTLFRLSWGQSGVNGLHVMQRCSVGGSWWYALSNETSKPLTFKYGFAGDHRDHAVMLRPHAQLTLRDVAPKFACDTDGPLNVSP